MSRPGSGQGASEASEQGESQPRQRAEDRAAERNTHTPGSGDWLDRTVFDRLPGGNDVPEPEQTRRRHLCSQGTHPAADEQRRKNSTKGHLFVEGGADREPHECVEPLLGTGGDEARVVEGREEPPVASCTTQET